MKLRQVVFGVVAAALVAVALILVGVEPLYGAGWGIVAGAATLVIASVTSLGWATWPPMKEPPEPTTGSEVARLAWSFDPRTGVAGYAVKRRVRALAARRLADHGIDLSTADDATLVAALGATATGTLRSESPTMPDIRTTLDALTALERTDRRHHE